MPQNITTVRKVRVVQADPANPFALDANGKPDPSVFNDAVFIEASTASISFTPTAAAFDNDRTSGSWGMGPPIPENALDASGNPYKVYTGTISLTARMRGLGAPEEGDDFESYDDLPLIWLWKSAALKADTDILAANWGDTLNGNGTDNNSGIAESGAGLVAGTLFQAVVLNDAVVHNINYYDSNDDSVHFTPSWYGVNAGSDIPDDSAIRTMFTLSPDLKGGIPVHIQFIMDTFAVNTYGCSATSAGGVTVGETSLDAVFTLEAGQFEFDYATTAYKNNSLLTTRVPRPCGKVAQRKGAKFVVSAPLPEECRANALADYKVDVAQHLCARDFSFTITNTIERVPCSDNLLGLQELRIVNQEFEATMIVTSTNASDNQDAFALKDDHANETRRNYSFAFGPHGEGYGFGLFIPAGYLKQPADIPDLSAGTVGRNLVIGADEWFGDSVEADGTIEAGGTNANGRFKLGFTR